MLQLLTYELESVTQAQILKESDCVSFHTIILEKCMNPCVFPYKIIVEQTIFICFGKELSNKETLS